MEFHSFKKLYITMRSEFFCSINRREYGDIILILYHGLFHGGDLGLVDSLSVCYIHKKNGGNRDNSEHFLRLTRLDTIHGF